MNPVFDNRPTIITSSMPTSIIRIEVIAGESVIIVGRNLLLHVGHILIFPSSISM